MQTHPIPWALQKAQKLTDVSQSYYTGVRSPATQDIVRNVFKLHVNGVRLQGDWQNVVVLLVMFLRLIHADARNSIPSIVTVVLPPPP